LLARCGLRTHYHSFFRVWERDFEGDVCRGQRPFCEAFGAFLRSLGLACGLIDELTAACRARRESSQASARPLPGVRQTLGQLRQAGLVLGAIGNTDRSAGTLRDWLRRFDLETLWAAVLSSVDLGRAMPDAACYRTALEAMGLQAAEVAFVGHGAVELAGAADLGMPTVAVNHDPDAAADVYLQRFEQLVETVAVPRPLAAAG
jgi:HAD superfamily hydrolase (TIGR01509 family)